jgi:hypothetical protein
MIQSPVLSPLSLIPAAGDLPLPNTPEGAELADFGALLAQSSGQSAATAPEPALPQFPLAAAAGPAIPGKSLPVGLPLAELAMEPQNPAPAPSGDVPGPDCLPLVPLPLASTGGPVRPQPAKGKGKVQPDPGCEPKGAEPPTTSALPDPATVLPQPDASDRPVTLAGPGLTPPQPVLPEAEAAPPAPAMPDATTPPRRDPAAPALARAAPAAAFLRSVQPGRGSAEPPAAPQHPAPAPAVPVTQVRIELAPAQSLPPVMRLLAKEDVRAAPVLAVPEAPVAPAAGLAPSPAPLPLQQAMPVPTLAERPQDFSALIDRLIAAREAVAPQAMTISVAHTEFGQVHLRFRREEAGLAVSLASADPGFARAASALPPVLPVGDPQAAQLQPGQSAPRQDMGSTASQSGTGQQRQSQGERRDDLAQAQHQPGASRAVKPRSRTGIFA